MPGVLHPLGCKRAKRRLGAEEVPDPLCLWWASPGA